MLFFACALVLFFVWSFHFIAAKLPQCLLHGFYISVKKKIEESDEGEAASGEPSKIEVDGTLNCFLFAVYLSTVYLKFVCGCYNTICYGILKVLNAF